MDLDATAFAARWIEGWNDRTLETILGHYDDTIIFLSPYAARLNGSGRIEGIDALRAYWRRGLEANPDLHFDFEQVLVGFETVTILYRNRGQRVAETMEFNAEGKVIRSFACYEA